MSWETSRPNRASRVHSNVIVLRPKVRSANSVPYKQACTASAILSPEQSILPSPYFKSQTALRPIRNRSRERCLCEAIHVHELHFPGADGKGWSAPRTQVLERPKFLNDRILRKAYHAIYIYILCVCIYLTYVYHTDMYTALQESFWVTGRLTQVTPPEHSKVKRGTDHVSQARITTGTVASFEASGRAFRRTISLCLLVSAKPCASLEDRMSNSVS